MSISRCCILAQHYDTEALKPNVLSCVLRISAARGNRVLLTGDIEAEQEGHLVRDAAAELPSRVLVAPPHGSKTSSTSGFVASAAPQAAVERRVIATASAIRPRW